MPKIAKKPKALRRRDEREQRRMGGQWQNAAAG